MNDVILRPAAATALGSSPVSTLMIGVPLRETGMSGVMMFVALTGVAAKQV